jgi:hypothetical protein
MSTQTTTQKRSFIRVMQQPDPNAESIGLSQYGMSKLPGTVHIIQPKVDNEGRWVTGIDEESSSVAMQFETSGMKSTITLEKYKDRIKAVRERLQRQLGITDLTATSSYWDEFFIDLATLAGLDVKSNARHELYWYVLKANKVIMPDSTFKNSPEYWDSKFVAYEPEFEAANKNVDRVSIDKAISVTLNLKGNYNKLLLIARLLLGPSITNEQGIEVLYDKLRSWLDIKPRDNAQAIVSMNDRDIHDLQTEVNIRNAMNFGVIAFRNGQYFYGNDPIGRTDDMVIEYLTTPDNHHVYDAVVTALETKMKLALV